MVNQHHVYHQDTTQGINLALESRFNCAIISSGVIRLIVPLLHLLIVLLHVLGNILFRVPLLVCKRRLLSLVNSGLCFIGGDRAIGRVWPVGCGRCLFGVI